MFRIPSFFLLLTSYLLLLGLLLFKETEIHVPIIPVFNEMGVLVEVVFRGMFEYKESIIFEKFFGEDQVRNLGQLNQFIGRIGKNHIELSMARVDKFEYIGFDKG
jgi:hypothetical protein